VICLSLECLSLLEIPFFSSPECLSLVEISFLVFLFGVLCARCKLCFVSPICNMLLESV
jgi:hypothetical protein